MALGLLSHRQIVQIIHRLAMDSPYNVYAKQLLPRGLGHPLWIPEPGSDGEISIGDVGYINSGRFFRMFNVLYSARDRRNANGVPENFQILYLSLNQVDEGEIDVPHPICSATIEKIETGVDDVFELECNDDQGAFLLLKDSPTQAKLLLSKRIIKEYMLPNCEEWAAFAQSSLRPDDIRLVSGWVKTDQWFLGAIAQDGLSARMQLDANFAPSTDLEFLTPRSPDMNYGYRVGPAPSDLDIDVDTFDDNLSRNQCVFLSYYKLKYRWFFIKDLEGAAEPKNLQARRDNDDFGKIPTQDGESIQMDTSDDSGQASVHCKPWDPVDFILDYILLHSDAKVAFAGTEDIITLCGSNIPDDIPAYLARTRPQIVVDADGVGSLASEMPAHHASTTAAQGADHKLADGVGIRVDETNATSVTHSLMQREDTQDARKPAPREYVSHFPQSGACREWACRPAANGFAGEREVESVRAMACA